MTLKVNLELLEFDRRANLKLFIIMCVCVPLISYILNGFTQKLQPDNLFVGLEVYIQIFLWVSLLLPHFMYNRFYKSHVLPILIKSLSNFKLGTSEYPLSKVRNILKSCDICPDFKMIDFDDFFTGEIDGVGLTFAEVSLKNENSNIFHGCAILIEMPTCFDVEMILKSPAWNIDFLNKSRGSYKRIKMVNQQFEGRFDVYGSDNVLVYNFLTPDVVESIITVYDRFKLLFTGTFFSRVRRKTGKNQMCVQVHDNQILMLVPTGRDLFESSGLFKSVYKSKNIEHMAECLEAIINTVYALKLVEPELRKMK